MENELIESKVEKIFCEIYPGQEFMVSKCPDQFVKFKSTDKSFVRKNIDYEETPRDKEIIAIILESPHKKEFDKGVPIGPANGTTGRLFANKFYDFLAKSEISKQIDISRITEYKIALINAVQYQTSQGNKLNYRGKKKRDACWLRIYNDAGGKPDLENRINRLQPKIVINLCTKGRNNLQSYVHETLCAGNYIYTKGTHPSTWNFKYAKIE